MDKTDSKTVSKFDLVVWLYMRVALTLDSTQLTKEHGNQCFCSDS